VLESSGREDIHTRGLHYAISSAANVQKPNGDIYINNDEDWEWLEDAGKFGRWLRYVDFEKITDNRSAEPNIHRKARVAPWSYVSLGIDLDDFDISDFDPRPVVEGFVPRQKYCFAIFMEKASLEDIVDPIAKARETDAYPQTGEISNTRLYQIAKDAHEDGRDLVIFVLADFDPAGRQMSVSIGRKMQAFVDLFFPGLKFELVPVALTEDQVRELDLPSTPLKPTEKRADKWFEAFGLEQTEIDSIATLQPDVLREIVKEAYEPYYDFDLEDRVSEAEDAWLDEAQEAINEQIDPEVLAKCERAKALFVELKSLVADINERLENADIDLPEIVVPEPEIDEDAPRQALVSFDDDWITATRKLIAHKNYED
jgi:hypothetical protein